MITVVLVRPETQENIGFIARAMKNFELDRLLIIKPGCDPKGERAMVVSKHAREILEKAAVKDYAYFSELKKNFDIVVGTTSVLGSDYNIPRTPLTPEEFVSKIDGSQNIALVFGNEGDGLSNDEIKRCNFVITIPSAKTYSALNISHAASIIFYELYKKFGQNKVNSHIERISKKQKEVMMQKIESIISGLQFTTERKKETQKITWDKILDQAMMSKREAFVIMGLFRKIDEKINKSSRR
ncbi:TPA: RNA methyltransferase [Candidatus Woesearchaeota archaeon]|nr:RNA methyltransferase, TrmH family, group 1 [archaeon GW2011_AR15]MBS3103345.1 RNA methyltransferase [Candidatus Woesearchaeota archaeon]HIH42005.1 RNA methyltransferase [Candidatus Woesearchaeota archaeon]